LRQSTSSARNASRRRKISSLARPLSGMRIGEECHGPFGRGKRSHSDTERQRAKGRRQKTQGGEGIFAFCLFPFVFCLLRRNAARALRYQRHPRGLNNTLASQQQRT